MKPELKLVEDTGSQLEVDAFGPAPQQAEMPFAVVDGEPITQLPKDLYIPPDALQVFLEAFEGPLDLLLYLIRRQNLDVLDIPIAEITRQYMQYIDVMQELQLELAGEYLLMAAMLAEIKSRMLLPHLTKQGDEEEDPRAELVRRLQEYERFKKAAEDLDRLPRMERDTMAASADLVERKVVRVQPQVTLHEMLLAFREVLARADMFAHHHIRREQLSVRQRMSDILDRLREAAFIEFVRLFDPIEGRMGVTITFIAVLELMKEGLLEIVQTEPYAPIHVRPASGKRHLSVVGDAAADLDPDAENVAALAQPAHPDENDDPEEESAPSEAVAEVAMQSALEVAGEQTRFPEPPVAVAAEVETSSVVAAVNEVAQPSVVSTLEAAASADATVEATPQPATEVVGEQAILSEAPATVAAEAETSGIVAAADEVAQPSVVSTLEAAACADATVEATPQPATEVVGEQSNLSEAPATVAAEAETSGIVAAADEVAQPSVVSTLEAAASADATVEATPQPATEVVGEQSNLSEAPAILAAEVETSSIVAAVDEVAQPSVVSTLEAAASADATVEATPQPATEVVGEQANLSEAPATVAAEAETSGIVAAADEVAQSRVSNLEAATPADSSAEAMMLPATEVAGQQASLPEPFAAVAVVPATMGALVSAAEAAQPSAIADLEPAAASTEVARVLGEIQAPGVDSEDVVSALEPDVAAHEVAVPHAGQTEATGAAASDAGHSAVSAGDDVLGAMRDVPPDARPAPAAIPIDAPAAGFAAHAEWQGEPPRAATALQASATELALLAARETALATHADPGSSVAATVADVEVAAVASSSPEMPEPEIGAAPECIESTADDRALLDSIPQTILEEVLASELGPAVPVSLAVDDPQEAPTEMAAAEPAAASPESELPTSTVASGLDEPDAAVIAVELDTLELDIAAPSDALTPAPAVQLEPELAATRADDAVPSGAWVPPGPELSVASERIEPATLEVVLPPMFAPLAAGADAHGPAASMAHAPLPAAPAAQLTPSSVADEVIPRSEQLRRGTVTGLLEEYPAAPTPPGQRGGSVESVYEVDVAAFIPPLASFEHDPLRDDTE